MSLVGIRAFLASIPGMIIAGLVAMLLALSLYVWGLHIGPIGFDGLTEKLEDCRTDKRNLKSTLDDLAKQSRERVERTGKTVERIIYRDLPDADMRAKRVESAPLPGGCKTPKAILEADL